MRKIKSMRKRKRERKRKMKRKRKRQRKMKRKRTMKRNKQNKMKKRGRGTPGCKSPKGLIDGGVGASGVPRAVRVPAASNMKASEPQEYPGL